MIPFISFVFLSFTTVSPLVNDVDIYFQFEYSWQQDNEYGYDYTVFLKNTNKKETRYVVLPSGFVENIALKGDYGSSYPEDGFKIPAYSLFGERSAFLTIFELSPKSKTKLLHFTLYASDDHISKLSKVRIPVAVCSSVVFHDADSTDSSVHTYELLDAISTELTIEVSKAEE